SCMTFLLSVWGHKTHEVLLAAYLVVALLLLAYPVGVVADGMWRKAVLGPALTWTNPFQLAFAPYRYRGTADLTDLTGLLAFCFGGGAACVLLAIATVRRVCVGHASRPQRAAAPRRRWRVVPAPSLDWNPVLWREWHRRRPSRWVRVVWGVYIFGA